MTTTDTIAGRVASPARPVSSRPGSPGGRGRPDAAEHGGRATPVARRPPAPPPHPARALPEPADRRDRQHHPQHRAADLGRVLHAETSSLQWITDAYTLCFAALLIRRARSATASAPPLTDRRA